MAEHEQKEMELSIFKESFKRYIDEIVGDFKMRRRKTESPTNAFMELYKKDKDVLLQQMYDGHKESHNSAPDLIYEIVQSTIESAVDELHERIMQTTQKNFTIWFEDKYYYMVPNTSSKDHVRGSIKKEVMGRDLAISDLNMDRLTREDIIQIYIQSFSQSVFDSNPTSSNVYNLNKEHLQFLIPHIEQLMKQLKKDLE